MCGRVRDREERVDVMVLARLRFAPVYEVYAPCSVQIMNIVYNKGGRHTG